MTASKDASGLSSLDAASTLGEKTQAAAASKTQVTTTRWPQSSSELRRLARPYPFIKLALPLFDEQDDESKSSTAAFDATAAGTSGVHARRSFVQRRLRQKSNTYSAPTTRTAPYC